MANYNETDNFKTIVARKKQLTITLTINGVFTSVCKKWVQNICQDINCPNYHPTKKLCYFFQQGNCKNGNYCYYLHPPELQPKEIYRKELDYYNQEYNIKPMKGCMIITIKNQKICVCERWVQACALPVARRHELSCNEIHQRNHPFRKHLITPICEQYLHGKCTRGYNCYYYHPEELKPKVVETVSEASSSNEKSKYVVKKYTAMCLKYMLHTYDGKNMPCKYNNCNYAHNLGQITVLDHITKFDALMITNHQKIPLQLIYYEVYKCIKENLIIINEQRSLNSLPRINCPVPVPKNFIDIINIWIHAASLARKNNYENKFVLFADNNSDLENSVWALAKRIQLCEQDFNCEIQKLLINKKITKEDVCIHGQNCKRGSHVSTYDEKTGFITCICIDELVGNCRCHITTGEQAINIRKKLEQELENLKAKHDSGNKIIQNAIYNIAKKIVNTYCKIHLIKNLKYKDGSIGSKSRSKSIDSKINKQYKITRKQLQQILLLHRSRSADNKT